MKIIESIVFEARLPKGMASLKLKLVEHKPKKAAVPQYRVLVTHNGPTVGKSNGCLALVETEDEGSEQLRFHINKAVEQGWSQALGGRLQFWNAIPAPDQEFEGGAAAEPTSARPAKRKPGRPRKVRQ